MKRRDALRSLTVAGGASLLASKEALAETKDIKVLLTAPDRIRLGAIKIET